MKREIFGAGVECLLGAVAFGLALMADSEILQVFGVLLSAYAFTCAYVLLSMEKKRGS